MAKLKGICKNIDYCDLAADKVEQEAEKSNFVCSECGKPLTQVGGTKPTDGGPNKKLIIIIIAAVVLIGGGAGAWFGGLFGGSSEPKTYDDTDSTTIVDKGEKDSIDIKPEPKPVDPEPKPVGPKFSWGKYSGPADGFGGELKVTKEHSIDLCNTNGDVIDVYPGDVIKQTKIKNGQLVSGTIFRTDGTRKYFEIGI